MSPTAGGYPPRPPKSPTVWCHSKVTARAERSSLSPRRGMQLQSMVRGRLLQIRVLIQICIPAWTWKTRSRSDLELGISAQPSCAGHR